MEKQVGEATGSTWEVKARLEEFGHHQKNEDDMLYEELDPGSGLEVTRIQLSVTGHYSFFFSFYAHALILDCPGLGFPKQQIAPQIKKPERRRGIFSNIHH